MPRAAREKYSEAIYHIMCRSIPEMLLFREDEDKNYYLGLLKRYTDKYKCKIYSYCMMDNHLHIQLDPEGFDVSKFMHSTNVAYVRYYNKKYQRYGPVFQERFESRILDTDEYNLTVSAYIHNNAKDMEGYTGREEEYRYSSYGIYLGKRKDGLKLVDMSFIMDLFNTSDKQTFADRYWEFTSRHRDTGNTKKRVRDLSRAIQNEYRSGRRVLLRNYLPAKVTAYIADKLMIKVSDIVIKSKRRLIEYRAVCAYAMRVLCGMNYKEICENMYNITVSACSDLCSKGHRLVEEKESFGSIFNELTMLPA